MQYHNPVLPGCYPDPSVCRGPDGYYMVNSSFEYFPAVPLFFSNDLIHWTQIGHCLTRRSQLLLHTGSQNNSGIYAPTIRYHDGTFYMITTNVGSGEGTGHFYVTSRDPRAGWSDPVFLPAPGIDPSLFFDEDGRVWMTCTGEHGIALFEVDVTAGRLLGEARTIWPGTGGACPEGPHLYRRNGWYYLLISEGGTERCHMITMARSRAVTGPYEPCPYNPVMTNRSLPLPLQAIGHADLVADDHGGWWALCLGIRSFGYPPCHNLGRETMLVPVDWQGEWPRFGQNGSVQLAHDMAPWQEAMQKEGPMTLWADDFSSPALRMDWVHLYNPDPALYEQSEFGLILHGNARALHEPETLAWVGRRQQHHRCSATVLLRFPCEQEGEEAGLSIYMNHLHHDDLALTVQNGERCLILRRRIGSLVSVDAVLPWPAASVTLRITADTDWYRFYVGTDEGDLQEVGRGETRYLSTEVGGAFTGNCFALYACGNGQPCKTPAVFSRFEYEGRV